MTWPAFEPRPYFETLITHEELLEQMAAQPVDNTPYLIEGYQKFPITLRHALSFEAFLECTRASINTDAGRQAMAGVMAQMMDQRGHASDADADVRLVSTKDRNPKPECGG